MGVSAGVLSAISRQPSATRSMGVGAGVLSAISRQCLLLTEDCLLKTAY